jgi:transposase
MIRARSQAVMSDSETASVKSPTSRPAKNGTSASKVGRSPKHTKPKATRTRAGKAEEKLLRKIAAAKRRERELMQGLRERSRSVRDENPLNPRAKAARPTESGTFDSKVGRAAPDAPAPAATPQSDSIPPASEAATASTGDAAPTAEDLTPRLQHEKQSIALAALLRGASNSEAAKEAGVDRRTVFRWRQQEAFQAELHRIQSCICTALRTTSADLADESVQVIKEAIDKGQISAALELLQALNVLNGQPLTEIDGLDVETKPDPAVIFQAPTQPTTESAGVTSEPTPNVQFVGATAEPVKTQIPSETLDITDLPARQQSVIAAILSGKIAPDAAEEAGVSIFTLQRWMRSDEAFRQVLRNCRQEQTQRLQCQLLMIGSRALKVLRWALKYKRNVRVAFAILRGLRLVK